MYLYINTTHIYVYINLYCERGCVCIHEGVATKASSHVHERLTTKASSPIRQGLATKASPQVLDPNLHPALPAAAVSPATAPLTTAQLQVLWQLVGSSAWARVEEMLPAAYELVEVAKVDWRALEGTMCTAAT